MLPLRLFSSLLLLGTLSLSCSTMHRESNAGDPESLIKARGVTCGDKIGEFDSVIARSNGANTGTGNSCAGENGTYGYTYQCKELITRYFSEKYGSPMVPCNAGQCYEAFNAYKDDFEVFKNGSGVMPQKGDVIVFQGYTWGHVAIVTSVESGQINFIQQNMASATDSISIDEQGNAGSYIGFTTYGFIRSKKAPLIARVTNSGTNVGNAIAYPVDYKIENYQASQVCSWFDQHATVNTCLRNVKGFDAASNVLVDCKQKIFKTCTTSCKANSLGADDSCDGVELAPQTGKFTVVSNDAAARVESVVLARDLSADWVKNDLQNLCTTTLKTSGKSLNTCRRNFNAGDLQGRFDGAKASGSETANWLIDCTGGSEPRWLQCNHGCVAKSFGAADSCAD